MKKRAMALIYVDRTMKGKEPQPVRASKPSLLLTTKQSLHQWGFC